MGWVVGEGGSEGTGEVTNSMIESQGAYCSAV